MIPLSCKPTFLQTFANGFQTPLQVYRNKEMFMSPLFSEKPWRRFAPLFKTFLEPYHGMIIFDHLFNNFFLVFLILVCLNLVDFVL
jgi:hypothetical protein